MYAHVLGGTIRTTKEIVSLTSAQAPPHFHLKRKTAIVYKHVASRPKGPRELWFSIYSCIVIHVCTCTGRDNYNNVLHILMYMYVWYVA